MSITSKAFAASAALAMAGGVGAVGLLGTPVGATTPSCGDNCVTLFNRTFGHHSDPGFVFDTWRQGARVGQPVILYRQSMSDPAEDFTLSFQGTVSDFYAAGLVSSAVVLHYGGGCVTSARPALARDRISAAPLRPARRAGPGRPPAR